MASSDRVTRLRQELTACDSSTLEAIFSSEEILSNWQIRPIVYTNTRSRLRPLVGQPLRRPSPPPPSSSPDLIRSLPSSPPIPCPASEEPPEPTPPSPAPPSAPVSPVPEISSHSISDASPAPVDPLAMDITVEATGPATPSFPPINEPSVPDPRSKSEPFVFETPYTWLRQHLPGATQIWPRPLIQQMVTHGRAIGNDETFAMLWQSLTQLQAKPAVLTQLGGMPLVSGTPAAPSPTLLLAASSTGATPVVANGHMAGPWAQQLWRRLETLDHLRALGSCATHWAQVQLAILYDQIVQHQWFESTASPRARGVTIAARAKEYLFGLLHPPVTGSARRTAWRRLERQLKSGRRWQLMIAQFDWGILLLMPPSMPAGWMDRLPGGLPAAKVWIEHLTRFRPRLQSCGRRLTPLVGQIMAGEPPTMTATDAPALQSWVQQDLEVLDSDADSDEAVDSSSLSSLASDAIDLESDPPSHPTLNQPAPVTDTMETESAEVVHHSGDIMNEVVDPDIEMDLDAILAEAKAESVIPH
ncbi:MAG: hypothetical protein M1837_002246 [Sclerophora amabilis]|nr:MAG: hypothetical protein M1837_002246 [Sclerophora amabilis]